MLNGSIILVDGIEGKICSACKLWKPISEFGETNRPNSRSGVRSSCRKCETIRSGKTYNKNRIEINAKRKKPRKRHLSTDRLDGKKRCGHCKEWKDESEFSIQVARKDGLSPICKKCKSENASKRRSQLKISDPDGLALREKTKRQKDKENNKNYRKASKEEVSEYQAQYYKNNKDRLGEYRQQWAKDNLSSVKESKRKSREKRKDIEREYGKQYRATHPESVGRHNHERIARKKMVGGIVWDIEWKWLLAITGHRCLWCGATNVKLTRDHIVPYKMLGRNVITNIQPLCKTCNSRKNTTAIDFRPQHVRELAVKLFGDLQNYIEECPNKDTSLTLEQSEETRLVHANLAPMFYQPKTKPQQTPLFRI